MGELVLLDLVDVMRPGDPRARDGHASRIVVPLDPSLSGSGWHGCAAAAATGSVPVSVNAQGEIEIGVAREKLLWLTLEAQTELDPTRGRDVALCCDGQVLATEHVTFAQRSFFRALLPARPDPSCATRIGVMAKAAEGGLAQNSLPLGLVTLRLDALGDGRRPKPTATVDGETGRFDLVFPALASSLFERLDLTADGMAQEILRISAVFVPFVHFGHVHIPAATAGERRSVLVLGVHVADFVGLSGACNVTCSASLGDGSELQHAAFRLEGWTGSLAALRQAGARAGLAPRAAECFQFGRRNRWLDFAPLYRHRTGPAAFLQVLLSDFAAHVEQALPTAPLEPAVRDRWTSHAAKIASDWEMTSAVQLARVARSHGTRAPCDQAGR